MRRALLAVVAVASLQGGRVAMAGPVVAEAAPPPPTLLVLDGSRGMAEVAAGDRPRIDLARTVVGDVLADWKRDVHLGLAVYGHRHADDCADVELLIPPIAVGNPKAFVSAVGAVEPTGRASLAGSVLQAACELRYDTEPATLVVVTDGREECGGDPCRTGRELEARAVDLAIHVVRVGAGGDADGARCLAQATGGRYVEAAGASDLRAALREALWGLAPPAASAAPAGRRRGAASTSVEVPPPAVDLSRVGRSAPRPAGGEAPGAAVADVPAPAPSVPTATGVAGRALGGIEVRIVAGPTFEPRPGALFWRVVDGRTARVVTVQRDPTGVVLAPPGPYTVLAAWGVHGGVASVDVVPGVTTPVDVIIEDRQAILEASVRPSVDAAPFVPPDDDNGWSVFREGPGGREDRLFVSREARPRWSLPAGTYRVRATRELAMAEERVDVAPGDEHTLALTYDR